MNDLVDSTAFLVSTAADDPWVTAVSVLKALAVSLRNAETNATEPSMGIAADWIESQIENFVFSALELRCTSSPATTNQKKPRMISLKTSQKSSK